MLVRPAGKGVPGTGHSLCKGLEKTHPIMSMCSHGVEVEVGTGGAWPAPTGPVSHMARSGHWGATEGFEGEEEGRWCEHPENAPDATWRRGGRCAGREPLRGAHATTGDTQDQAGGWVWCEVG